MSREALIRELRSMSKRELTRNLEALSPAERAQVLELVHPPGASGEPKDAPFDVLAGLSPFFLKAIEAGEEATGSSRLTPATRSAIRSALNEISALTTPALKPHPRPKRSPLSRLLGRQGRAHLQ